MGFRFFIITLFIFTGCGLVDQSESEPAYVIVEDVSVKNPNGSGTVSHDISDLWSFLNGENLGVYPYPSHIACLPAPESNTLSFIGGIRENGIAKSISIYPMLEPLEYQIELTPGENHLINPSFSYRNDVIIRFDEGFESSPDFLSFDADNNIGTKLERDTEYMKTGFASGKLSVPDSLDFVEIATAEAYPSIPVDGSVVYLELDYLSSADIFIGLIGYQDPVLLDQPLKSYYLGLVPVDEWKKIYVNLTEPLFESGLAAYRILIRAENNGDNTEEIVRLDNLKLLHF